MAQGPPSFAVAAIGFFVGMHIASWTMDTRDVETEARLEQRLKAWTTQIDGLEREVVTKSQKLVGSGPQAKGQALVGQMGQEFTRLSFDNEVFRATLVNIENVPPFFMVDPDTNKVDNMLSYLTTSETFLIRAFKNILLTDPCYPGVPKTQHPPCLALTKYKDIGDRAVVLDIGSNSGFYSLLSASLGYRVIGVDPQPHCAQFVRIATVLSGLDHKIVFHNAFAGTKDQPREVPPRTGCWGTFPYITTGQAFSTDSLYTETPEAKTPVKVPTIAVDDLVDPEHDVVVVMKVDVEGHEKHVFDGARRMLQARKILNMFVGTFSRSQTTGRTSIRHPFWTRSECLVSLRRAGSASTCTFTCQTIGDHTIAINAKGGL
eukprot:c12159_g1_i1.p1 GENE.c12159_g1_i1~~c12159_g1_i1.p1  ORF type:complete len:390 (+),score=73.99 c12159_g1_i1:47-1171(+)